AAPASTSPRQTSSVVRTLGRPIIRSGSPDGTPRNAARYAAERKTLPDPLRPTTPARLRASRPWCTPPERLGGSPKHRSKLAAGYEGGQGPVSSIQSPGG